MRNGLSPTACPIVHSSNTVTIFSLNVVSVFPFPQTSSFSFFHVRLGEFVKLTPTFMYF